MSWSERPLRYPIMSVCLSLSLFLSLPLSTIYDFSFPFPISDSISTERAKEKISKRSPAANAHWHSFCNNQDGRKGPKKERGKKQGCGFFRDGFSCVDGEESSWHGFLSSDQVARKKERKNGRTHALCYFVHVGHRVCVCVCGESALYDEMIRLL